MWQRDIAVVIKGADLERKRLSCVNPSRPNPITQILKIRTEEDLKTEGRSERCSIAGSEQGGRGHEPGMWGPREAGKSREQILF